MTILGQFKSKILINIKIIFLLTFLFNDIYSQEIIPLTSYEIQQSIEQNLAYESDNNTNLLVYRGFIINFNYLLKIPNFTIHRLSFDQIDTVNKLKAKRRNGFYTDDIYTKNYCAINADYKKSGYDRGHMVPAGDFYSDQLLKNETFVLTNIAPQNPSLNRGIWAYLENMIRKKTSESKSNAFVITGVIFMDSTSNTIGRNRVGVPNYFYKIVFYPDQEIMYAFMFDNFISEYLETLSNYQVKVNDIEKIVNEDFFDNLPDELEEKLESNIFLFEINL